MSSLDNAFGALLGGLVRRLSALSDRQRQVRLIAERVSLAKKRYRQLEPAARAEARRTARRLVGLRRQLALLTESPACCRDCAARLARTLRQTAPELPGGYCCGGDPQQIFDELEVAALWLAGRPPSRWAMLHNPTGCLYRGRNGCVLRPEDRPSICGRYLCSELTEALSRNGSLCDIMECNDALEVEMARIGVLLGLTPTR